MNEISKQKLEDLIDKCGLPLVLDHLSDICAEKAYHIQYNWQDKSTAIPWEQMSGRLVTASDVAKKKGL